jgi:Family of unknown function (DUF6600)
MEGAMRLRFPASLLGRLIVGAMLAAFAALGLTIEGSALAARAKPAASHAASKVAGSPVSHASLSGEFHRALDRHGHWTPHRRWGEAWVPDRVPQNWRPYKTGKWLYTDEWGWYWAADEEWGWVTYHYGRWAFDREFGWIWVPGDEWGPAWVRWRRGGTHIGWCPLPPDDIVAETDTDPDLWIFVEAQDLVAPEIDVVVLAFAETAVFIRETVIVNQTIIVRNKNVVVAANLGVSPSIVAAALKHPVQSVSVHPKVVAGTQGVTGASVAKAGARGRTATREVIQPQGKLIQPAASVPGATRFRPGHAAAAGPDTPNVLKHGGQISTKTQAAPPSATATAKPQPKATSEKRATAAQTAMPKGKQQRHAAEKHRAPPHKATTTRRTVTAHRPAAHSVTRRHAAAPVQRHAARPPVHRASQRAAVQRHAAPLGVHRAPPSAGRASSPAVTHHAPAPSGGHAMTPSASPRGGPSAAHGPAPGPGRKEH